jgi:hypothetical protein
MVTAVDPGVQGAAITGRHGCGTSGPAEDAAATCGLASDWQRPNEGTFAAWMSVTAPAPVGATTFSALAENVAGDVPIEHCRAAPVQTRFVIGHITL